MQRKRPEISVIIVHYHVKEELFNCLESIYASKPKVRFEIIIVDNDENKTIEESLLKRFPHVIYIKNPKNTGWGAGTNLGIKHAIGQYIYLLNPDTIVFKNTLDALYQFSKMRKNIGVAASLLLDDKKQIYKQQGTGLLNPLVAIVVFSFINKLFPNNLVSQNFWRENQDRSSNYSIPVAPLSAALIKKNIFEKVHGFDENFFLYFEEYDLSKKLAKMNLVNYTVIQSRAIHLWGKSTKDAIYAREIFKNSRNYYFKKYYGSFWAFIVKAFLSLNGSAIKKLFKNK